MLSQIRTLCFGCLMFVALCNLALAIPGWPEEVRAIRYLSTGDSTLQSAAFYAPITNKASPLLVGLHSWSANYQQTIGAAYAAWCIENHWVLIYPDFRGVNNKPEATGSELVIADILSVVDYAKQNANVDTNRIYLVGFSGGGMAALSMAGRSPDIWAGVSAWAPLIDLNSWYFETKARGLKYTDEIVRSTGGVPGTSEAVDLQYERRSPITYLRQISASVDINAGIGDAIVLISHSLIAFNRMASPADRLSEV